MFFFLFFSFNSLKPDALQLGRSGGDERRCLKFATRAGAVRGAEEDRETQAAGFPGGSGPAASRSKTHILLNTLKTSATDAHCIVLKGQEKKKKAFRYLRGNVNLKSNLETKCDVCESDRMPDYLL